ncbi:senecionine N-oxygenase-like isoform X2 [Daphnia pulicaria]|nr:senecionine N-oxygenase-like isoform X2 [Daphnia pulicaria]XP_046654593.1 senecionine N-oxygenase-like isoform X2 [Daphnia pulicaria]XP_046654594.1 senecionine N-oxygenase-like isoform X2 [Daphnia pulicaria]
MDHPATARIAIIGAGPSGLSQMRAFALLESSGQKIPEIVCFEKQNDWGGMWNYTWRTGFDKYGEPVHGSMYRHLWSNAPKECHEFADYSFDHHFSKSIPSFIPREAFRDYILGRAEESNMRRCIQFNTVVSYVEFDREKEIFHVRKKNLTTGKSSIEDFDYVIVAVGHFSMPNVPYVEGIETFPGQVIHSHDFRDARQFAEQSILVIGGSLSAEDIALQTFKFGAKSITISYRTKPIGCKWPSKIEEKPLLTRMEGRSAHFPDGSERDFDSIILCTGYKHHFPFLNDDLRLVTTNCFYPSQLYKGIFFQEQPRLIYLGMQNLYFSLSLFDAQTWYVRDVILGRIPFPNKLQRAEDMLSWKTREEKIKDKLDALDFQTAYLKELTSATDYPLDDLRLSGTAATFKNFLDDKESNIINYRDKQYTSSITGTKAVMHPTPWMEVNNYSSVDFL